MAVKVDQGFLNALISLFASGSMTEEEQLAQFKADVKMLETELKDDAAKASAGEQKNYYDILHFSPLKVCCVLVGTPTISL